MIARKPLAPHLGIELTGIDLTRRLDPAAEQAILDAWIEAGVLLLRGAGVSDDAHMRLSGLFGDLEPAATHAMNDRDNPYLMHLLYDPDDSKPQYQRHYELDGVVRHGWLGWHWDQSFMPTIVRGAVLRMVEPAAQMGETGFIDAIGAYDRLSEAQKRRIEGLEVVYQYNPDFVSGQFGFPKGLRALPRAASGGETKVEYHFPPAVHPLVITQAETGRKVLKLSPMHARRILGMERSQSDALLEEIAAHLTDPAFAYHHRWGKDDLIVWDNWRIIHSASGVPIDCKRHGTRTTILGDYNSGRYLDPALDRERAVPRLVD